jgi:hypothetical protein
LSPETELTLIVGFKSGTTLKSDIYMISPDEVKEIIGNAQEAVLSNEGALQFTINGFDTYVAHDSIAYITCVYEEVDEDEQSNH